MNIYAEYKLYILAIIEELVEEGKLPAGLDMSKITVEPIKDPTKGDMSTNAAMVLAKQANMKPTDISKLILEKILR